MKRIICVIAFSLVEPCLFAAGVCPVPTDANNCTGNEEPTCLNSCYKITGPSPAVKNQDCQGSSSTHDCTNNPTGGTAGETQWTYVMLDAAGNATTLQPQCVTCGSTVLTGPTAIQVTCRTATASADEPPKCRGGG